jgi:phosphoribosyl-ATP pyrophosphohydrolase/phosphoribosyl-AMP cyclohydrolase
MDGLVFDDRGLIPIIVQDVRTGRVLMLGYGNAESLAATEATGLVHFWSRSRDELWRKGATSGNTLRVVTVAADCDRDAVLIRAIPAGPVCHTGAASCFDAPGGQGFDRLETLWGTIGRRLAERPDGSYTVRLVDEGVDGPGRKIVEEATEVLLAAKDHAAGAGDDLRVAEEAADVVYHLLVLLAERGIEPRLVLDVLDERSR